MRSLYLLTAHPELYTPRRLLEEARAQGLECEFLRPRPWWSRQSLQGLTAGCFLTRAGPFQLVTTLRTHRLLEATGLRALVSRHAFLNAADQGRCLRRLQAAGLPIPASVWVRTPDAATTHQLPGPPWFVKGRLGSKGSHVLLARNPAELRRATAFLWGQGSTCLVQEDARRLGAVRRLLMLGSTVLACSVVRPAAGEYRSNWHRGGTLHAEDPAPEHTRLARQALAAVGLPWGGVDLLGDGPQAVVLEVNASPGLEGAEAMHGRDLTRRVVQFLRRTQGPALQSCDVDDS